MMKKAQVVLLPTNQKVKVHSIVSNKTGQLAMVNPLTIDDPNKAEHIHKHLYFTTDDKIEVGDWALSNGAPARVTQINRDGIEGEYTVQAIPRFVSNIKKIVATTNPALWSKNLIGVGIDEVRKGGLPKIGTDFVEAYVREQGKITEVMLEYGCKGYCDRKLIGTYCDKSCFPVLKIRDNGTVIIHPVKPKVFTRREVEEIAYLAYVSGISDASMDVGDINPFFDEWFNRNVPNNI
jgi:hypothetical protein